MLKEFIKKLSFEEYFFETQKFNKKIITDKLQLLDNKNSNFYYRYSNDSLYFKSEIALWKGVILQAFVDLQNNSKKKIANTYRIKALMWFNLNNKDFITVCDYANLDPKYVYGMSRDIKNKSKFL